MAPCWPESGLCPRRIYEVGKAALRLRFVGLAGLTLLLFQRLRRNLTMLTSFYRLTVFAPFPPCLSLKGRRETNAPEDSRNPPYKREIQDGGVISAVTISPLQQQSIPSRN